MTVEIVLDVVKGALIRTLLIAGPTLVISMIVGLIISIIQATTQIQEQTLSFVPKLVAIFLTFILAGNFMLNVLIEFTRHLFELIAKM